MTRSRRTRNQTRLRVAAALAAAATIVGISAAGCGSADGLVGGGCASAYTQCGLSCFNLQTDPNNCGACGNVCDPGVACVSGVCASATLDATTDDGSMTWTDGAGPDGDLPDGYDTYCDANQPGCHRIHEDASGDDASPIDGSTGDDGSTVSEASTGDGSAEAGLPDASPSDGCVPPFDTPANCGACGTVCTAANPLCALEDGGYQCAPICAPPLTDCGGRCVNLSHDPDNCGTCGNVCPSQYCFLATCQGTVAGNIIVIGHDFDTAKATDQQAKLLTNSVFYNPPTVRLLSYEHYVNAAAVANAKAILTAYAKAQTDTLTITVTTDDTFIANQLTIKNEDAVIVWDQPMAPSGTLGALGSQWAASLTSFAQGGGTVIVLDAAQGVAQMPALETNAALLAVTGHTAVVAGSEADVPLAGLAIGRGMTSVYPVGTNSASFTTSEAQSPTTLYVANVHGAGGELLAVQKIVN